MNATVSVDDQSLTTPASQVYC